MNWSRRRIKISKQLFRSLRTILRKSMRWRRSYKSMISIIDAISPDKKIRYLNSLSVKRKKSR